MLPNRSKFQEVVCFLGLATIVAFLPSAFAQFPAGYSSTGPEAALLEKKKKEALAGAGAYNMKLGPVKFRLGLGMRQEYNDNVTLAKGQDQRDDYITTAHVDINAVWPFSRLNTLDFTFGVLRSKYWNNPKLDTQSFLIAPNSALDFNVYVGDVKFNLFDKLSLQEDPSSQPQLSGVSSFRRFENTLGLHIDWDLNKILLGGGYERYMFKALSGASGSPDFSSLDHDTDTISGSVGYKINPDLISGVQANMAETKYSGTGQNNGTSKTVGVFIKGVITKHITTTSSIGYQMAEFDRGGSIGDNSDFESYVYSVALKHEMNRLYSHDISFNRYIQPGIGTNFSSLNEISYGFSWDLIKNVDLTGKMYFQMFQNSGSGPSSEKADRYGLSLLATYPLFRSWDISLDYDVVLKDSSNAANNYLQNRVFLDLTYHF